MRASRLLNTVLRTAAVVTLLILGLILTYFVLRSLPFFLAEGPISLITDDGWFPAQAQFNLVPMIIGSLWVATGAVLLAAPAGVLLAMFAHFYAPPWLARVYRLVVEVLAGIPSVVYGFWGLVVLVPLIAAVVPPGASILAAIIVLALMLLPLMLLVVDQAITQLPPGWIKAAQALALTRWSVIRKLVLPTTWPQIYTGFILQSSRAIGETMAVLMVCGNVIQIPGNLFEPARTLTAHIALEMAYATDTHADALFVAGLLLLLMSVLLVRAAHRYGRMIV